MYYPKLFSESDPAVIDAFIRAHGFATLVTARDGVPESSHVPLELVHATDGTRVLEGHFARANGQWRHLEAGAPVLAIFAGPHAYVSSSWYADENVPTWNYMVVHAWGTARLVNDEGEVRDMLRRLSRHYEPGGAFDVDRLTPGFYAKEVRGIVAFTIRVERLAAKFKLSQNRNEADHANVVRRLRERPDDDSRGIAEAMAARHRQRFSSDI